MTVEYIDMKERLEDIIKGIKKMEYYYQTENTNMMQKNYNEVKVSLEEWKVSADYEIHSNNRTDYHSI